jgi:outer membrane biogenesis lipoprotein LolB
MKRLLFLAALVGLLAACTADGNEPPAAQPTAPTITVFRPPT